MRPLNQTASLALWLSLLHSNSSVPLVDNQNGLLKSGPLQPSWEDLFINPSHALVDLQSSPASTAVKPDDEEEEAEMKTKTEGEDGDSEDDGDEIEEHQLDVEDYQFNNSPVVPYKSEKEFNDRVLYQRPPNEMDDEMDYLMPLNDNMEIDDNNMEIDHHLHDFWNSQYGIKPLGIPPQLLIQKQDNDNVIVQDELPPSPSSSNVMPHDQNTIKRVDPNRKRFICPFNDEYRFTEKYNLKKHLMGKEHMMKNEDATALVNHHYPVPSHFKV